MVSSKLTAAIVLVLATVAFTHADDDPVAVLAKKQQDRAAARAATTQISMGELDDLTVKIRMLQAQNDALNEKLAGSGAAQRPAIRQYEEIEVGMTKEELLYFVRKHAGTMRIGMFSTTAGGVMSDRSQTIVTKNIQSRVKVATTGRSDVNVRVNGNVNRRNVSVNGNIQEDGNADKQSDLGSDGTENTTVERRRVVSKRSTVNVALIGFRRDVTQEISNGLGGSGAKAETVAYECGHIHLELTDDIITSIQASETN